MEVMSGSSWSTTTGMRQYSIALNDSDGEALNSKWSELTWNDKLKFLQRRADILVIKYMVENNAMTKEYAAQRISEINGTN